MASNAGIMLSRLLDIWGEFSVSLDLESLAIAQLKLKDGSVSASSEETLTRDDLERCNSTIDALFSFAHVPSIDKSFEGQYDMNTFTDVSHKSAMVMNSFELILDQFDIDGEVSDISQKLIRFFFTKCLILCTEHADSCPWTSTDSEVASKTLLAKLLSKSCCATPNDLLVRPPDECVISRGLAKSIFEFIMPYLMKDTWKLNPASVQTFKWCLQMISFPNLSDFLLVVFPTSLLFVDDFEKENKLLGIACLQHVIANVSSTELSMYGQAEVLYEALQHQLYTHDPQVLDALLPCLLSCLIILEPAPRNAHQPRTESRFDVIIQRYLTDMDLEQQVMTRRVYISHLSTFIDVMGIVIVRHMSSMLRMIGNYLEIPDGPEEVARMKALECINVLLQNIWPCIHRHEKTLLKYLLKLFYNVSTDEGITQEHIKTELLQSATKTLVQLRIASSGRIDAELEDILQTDIDIVGKNYMEQAFKYSLIS